MHGEETILLKTILNDKFFLRVVNITMYQKHFIVYCFTLIQETSLVWNKDHYEEKCMDYLIAYVLKDLIHGMN